MKTSDESPSGKDQVPAPTPNPLNDFWSRNEFTQTCILVKWDNGLQTATNSWRKRSCENNQARPKAEN
jgi:hypothetical protein